MPCCYPRCRVADGTTRTGRRTRPFGVTAIVVLLLVAAVVALPSSLLLVKEFWQAVIIVLLLAFLVTLVVQNLDELRRT